MIGLYILHTKSTSILRTVPYAVLYIISYIFFKKTTPQYGQFSWPFDMIFGPKRSTVYWLTNLLIYMGCVFTICCVNFLPENPMCFYTQCLVLQPYLNSNFAKEWWTQFIKMWRNSLEPSLYQCLPLFTILFKTPCKY